jgi:putative transcriptional regulator
MSLKEFWEKRFGPRGPRFECHLRELREAAGVSVEALAEHCKVSNETITLIEDARYEPSVVLAEHIAGRLNTTVESIFTAHAPFAPFSAGFEERLRSKHRLVGAWSFFILLSVSLIAANILFQYTTEEGAALALGALFFLGDIAYLIGVTRIPGYWRFNRRINRTRNTKRNFWIAVIGSPILFATIMELFNVNRDHTWQRRILSFLFYAIFWGGWMYWVQYRKVKPKKNSNA